MPAQDQQSNAFRWMHDIAARVSNHALYGVIPTVTEVPLVRSVGNTFANQVEQLTKCLTGLNGKSGLGVFIGFPHTEGIPDTEGSIRTHLVTEVSVVESRIYNTRASTGFAPGGVGFHSDDVAYGLALNLTNWESQGVADRARPRTILYNHEGWIPPDLRDGSEKFDLLVTAFQLQALLSLPLPPRCYVPTILVAAGNFTLSSNTGGATMYYTLDGSAPTDESAAYAGVPVPVAGGATVRAVATKAGLDDSSFARAVAP